MKDKLKGKAEELKGKSTGDRVEQLKGKGRQALGDIKQTAKAAAYDAEAPGEGREIRPRREDEHSRSSARLPLWSAV